MFGKELLLIAHLVEVVFQVGQHQGGEEVETPVDLGYVFVLVVVLFGNAFQEEFESNFVIDHSMGRPEHVDSEVDGFF